MGKAEIQMRIEQLRGEIQNLNANKNLYQNMNDKIGEAMDKLRSAKEHTDSAEKLLVKYYQSEVAGKKAADLDLGSIRIENVMNELTYTILVVSTNKINDINISISNKENQIKVLSEQMNRIKS